VKQGETFGRSTSGEGSRCPETHAREPVNPNMDATLAVASPACQCDLAPKEYDQASPSVTTAPGLRILMAFSQIPRMLVWAIFIEGTAVRLAVQCG
jgi:hypothetical protein